MNDRIEGFRKHVISGFVIVSVRQQPRLKGHIYLPNLPHLGKWATLRT